MVPTEKAPLNYIYSIDPWVSYLTVIKPLLNPPAVFYTVDLWVVVSCLWTV